TFSKEVMIAGKAVPPATYAIFTIPGKTTWTVILNKNANQGGTDNYKEELDQLRFTAKPKAVAHREHLTFQLVDFNDDAATLGLEWDKLRVEIPIKLETAEQTQKGIAAIDDSLWRQYNTAARYVLE